MNGSTITFNNGGAVGRAVDMLMDGSTTDNDTLNVTVTANAAVGGGGIAANTTDLGILSNIETINLNVAAGAPAVNVISTSITGAKTLNVTGSPTAALTMAGTALADTGITTVNAAGMTTGGIVINSSTAASTAALTVTGSAAADNITTGLGADTVNAGSGNDIVLTGAGADTVNGGAGDDRISGGNENDTLNGEAGADVIDGGNGADVINGGAGNDVIIAGAGNDVITGGAGNDAIALGTVAGNMDGQIAGTNVTAAIVATLTAAAGNNTVVFAADLATNGVDSIAGFETATTAVVAGAAAQTGLDVLDLSAFLGKAVTNYVEIGSTDGVNNVTGSNVVVVTDGTLATAQGEAPGNAGIVFGANAKTVVVAVNATTNTIADVVFVTTDSNGNILSQDVVATLVGVTATASDISGFAATNFA